MTRPRTIRIVGAGPAGLTAAINLASAGRRVIVHEQHADVGNRFHGDLQGLESWSSEDDALDILRTMGVRPEFFHHPITVADAYGPRTHAHFGSSNALFYLLKRGSEPDSLDSALKRQALSLGVEIEFNSRVEPGRGDIVATGPRRADVVAVGIVFDTEMPDTAAVALDDGLAPKGYSYLLAANGRATLAATLFDRVGEGKIYLERSLRRFDELFGLDVKNPRHFAGYGTMWRPRAASRLVPIHVGEAAGFQDNLFGFGIRYAMTTGYLAARSILEGVDYHALWRMQLGNQLRTSLVNRLCLELLGPRVYDFIVSRTGHCEDPRKLWMKYYNMSTCRPYLYPVALVLSRLRHGPLRP